jgi:hypothetical protein
MNKKWAPRCWLARLASRQIALFRVPGKALFPAAIGLRPPLAR